MKKYFLIILCLTLLSAGCGTQKNTSPQNSMSEIMVGNQKLSVEVMATDEQRQKGLSGRDSLPQQAGMLFDFTNTTSRKPSFWMVDMKFPIDIIWIRDNKVIGITPNVPPPAANTPTPQLPTYPPPSQIDYVLEVNAGWSEKNNVQVGDEVKL